MSVNYDLRPRVRPRRSYKRTGPPRVKQTAWRPMFVKVFQPSGSCMVLKVETACLISSIKAQIEEKTGVIVDRQTLRFQGLELNDNKTFVECKMPTALFLTILPATLHITIKTLHGKTITLETLESEKVLCLKERIHESEGISIEHQRLIYGAIELQDDRSVKDCDVRTGSIIFLALKFRKKLKMQPVNMHIFVKARSNYTVCSLQVVSCQTVLNIKNMIADRMNCDKEALHLVFGEQDLSNECSLCDYNIFNESTLFVHSDKTNDELRLLFFAFVLPGKGTKGDHAFLSLDKITESKETFHLYVNVKSKKNDTVVGQFELDVEPTMTVEALKGLIETEKGVGIEDQAIRFNGEVLTNDEATLLSCSIDYGSKLTVEVSGFSDFVMTKMRSIT